MEENYIKPIGETLQDKINWLQKELFEEKEKNKELEEELEKEKEKNKSLEQENSFLKMMYRGTDEFKAIENFIKEE